MSDTLAWRAVGAWDGVIAAESFAAAGAGVIVEPLSHLGMATVIARHGGYADVAALAQGLHGVAPPEKPAVARGANIDWVWTAPDQWLAISPERTLAATLEKSIGGVAAVTDQTGARAVLKVYGPCMRHALAKGCPIDLDSRVFGEGTAAVTVISLIGVTLWWLPNEDAIHIALFRSMAASFWSWLAESTAEYGLQVR